MAPTGTGQGITRPPFKPPTREVISIDSDSDSNAPAPPRPSNSKTPGSKVAVQPGTYANAPKFASAYVQSPHFPTPIPQGPQLASSHVAHSIESSNGNGYIKTSTVNVVGSMDGAATQQPTERQLEKMPAIMMDVNEVFENQSVTTTADHLERGTLAGDSDGENEDDEKMLFDESFPEIGDDALLNSDDPEMCTLQEARYYRNLLRTLGPRAFVAQTVESDAISAKKLITAFGCASPSWMIGAEDIQYYPYLQWALIRELNKRTKIDELNTVDDAARLLRKSKNIIVLTGAGISTSLGIPDFRSKDIGLYAKLEHLGLADPQEVFDIELFREDPSVFYSVAKDIIPDHKRFTPTHAFIKLLQDKGKLLTNYSQNIDNIEGVAGVRPEKLIQCHGSFATASCTKCGAKVPGESIFKEIRDGVIPSCKRCVQNLKPEIDGRKRKRSKNRSDSKKKSRKSKDFEDSSEEEEGAYDLPVAGVMKPDITFFGEALPDTFHERLTKHDRPLVDLVIVIGTSLKVAPVSEVVDFLDKVPTIYISREPVKHIYFDIDLLGDCDIVVAELCRRAGWGLDHEMIPKGQTITVTGDPNFPSRWTFKQTYPAPKAEKEEGKGKLEEELDDEIVDGRMVKVKKERKLPDRLKGSESLEMKKGKKGKKMQTWMEDGGEVTGVYKGPKKKKKISTWMENGREVTGEFQVKDSDSD